MTDSLLIDERRAIELVGLLASLKEQRAPIEREERPLVDQLKQWLQLHGLSSLHDGETGNTARIQERTTTLYDLVSAVATDDGEAAILHAAAAGLLRVDHTAFERFRKGNGAVWADVLARYAMPSTTEALVIDRDKR